MIAEIKYDGFKARGTDRLEQSGEETVRLDALRVARDKCQFSDVCEFDSLEEMGIIDCPQLA